MTTHTATDGRLRLTTTQDQKHDGDLQDQSCPACMADPSKPTDHDASPASPED